MLQKSILFTIIFTLFLATTAIAETWYVDNKPGATADFTDLQTAHDDASVQNGDIIYVAGSPTSYGDLTCTKQLFIYGPGYFLGENENTQAYKVSAKTGTIVFDSGSEGSIITGIYCTYFIRAYTNDITIKRNYIDNAVNVDTGVSNIIIAQNYIDYSNGSAIHVDGNCSNIIIKNNYLYGGYTINSNSSSELQIINNVMYGDLEEIYNSTIENNILRDGYYYTYSEQNNTVQNNLCNGDQFPAGNGNQLNVDMSTVFVYEGSTDGWWQLKDGSPAIGAGVNGEDCGMFGGDEPYVLSGLPPIPAVYYFNAPVSGSATEGLPVQVKVKAHN
jgi:hypothetical protein